MRKNPLSFFIASLAAQLFGFISGALISHNFPHQILNVLVPSVLAFTAVHILNLPRSWQILNALLPTALFLSVSIEVPPWIFLAVLFIVALFHLPAVWSRVPYYPTPRETYHLILEELPPDKPFSFIDLGCGIGDLLVFLAERRPNGNFHGVEIALAPYLISKFKSLKHSNVTISFKSFWGIHFGDYTFIYAFLSPAPMEKLWEKLKRERSTGSIFFSNSFEAPSSPKKVLGLKGKGTTIYVYSA